MEAKAAEERAELQRGLARLEMRAKEVEQQHARELSAIRNRAEAAEAALSAERHERRAADAKSDEELATSGGR